MDDKRIIELYWNRDEKALSETKIKYGSYCRSIAYNILHSSEDAEECENDTYVTAWNVMPPQKPIYLGAFLGKITRNLSLKRYREGNVAKRGGDNMTVSFDELSECIPDSGISDNLGTSQLSLLIDSFLRTLPKRERDVFISRYWYCDTVIDICASYGYGESRVKMMLLRTRKKLKEYLLKEGVSL